MAGLQQHIFLHFQIVLKLDGTIQYGRCATRYIFAFSNSFEAGWNNLQVGAGLHIVAAVTESCVTGLNDDNGDVMTR